MASGAGFLSAAMPTLAGRRGLDGLNSAQMTAGDGAAGGVGMVTSLMLRRGAPPKSRCGGFFLTGLLFSAPAGGSSLPAKFAGPPPALSRSCHFGDSFRFLECIDPTPAIADVLVSAKRAICQKVKRWLSIFRVARAPWARHDYEAFRDSLIDRGADRVPVNSIVDEVLIGAGKPAVFVRPATMARELDFQPIEDAARRQAQDSVRRAFQHLDQARGEWAVYMTFGHPSGLPAAIAFFLSRKRVADDSQVGLNLVGGEGLFLRASHGRRAPWLCGKRYFARLSSPASPHSARAASPS